MRIRLFFYAGQFIVRPRYAADRIAEDRAGVWAGLWLALLFLSAYSLTVLIYYLLGHQPQAAGFLAVSRERWYLVQTFTTIPVGLAGFLSMAALAHLLSRAWGGKGSFEGTFAGQMYANILPCALFMLGPELLLAPPLMAAGYTGVPWPEWVELLRVFILPLPWIYALAVLALARGQKIPWPRALLIVPVAWIPNALLMAVFIR
jgi:hypothetical protein